MKARIYQPAKTAMQSGRAKTYIWVLEFDVSERRFVEPLMGWTGAADTLGQLTVKFPTKEAALAYAAKHEIDYDLEEPHQRILARRAYADNFSFTRIR